MDRRAFLTGLMAVLAAPLAAKAQSTRTPYRVGYLSSGASVSVVFVVAAAMFAGSTVRLVCPAAVRLGDLRWPCQ